MRVRLSYSVELEDVPDSVAELIEGELFRIEQAKESIGRAYKALCEDEPHLGLVAKSLDKARQTLGAIDVRLNECESILAGYERAIEPPEEPQQHLAPSIPRPAMPAPTPPQPREERPTHPNVDPETGAYKYSAPYAVHTENPAEDQQFDGEPE